MGWLEWVLEWEQGENFILTIGRERKGRMSSPLVQETKGGKILE